MPWRLELPASLKGPIDETLPRFARVDGIQVSAGEDGKVGVLWHREVDHRTLHWDEEIERWRVECSELILDPSEYPRLPDSVLGDRPMEPRACEVFRPSEYLGMAVISSDGIEGSAFFDGYPASHGWRDVPDDLAYAEGKWHALLILPDSPANSPRNHPALISFDSRGWNRPQRIETDDWLAGSRLIPYTGGFDLLWTKYYLPFLAFPDSGQDRQHLLQARIRQGVASSPRALYEFPKLPFTDCYPVPIVRKSEGIYDLFYRRSGLGGIQLLHVRDVAHNWLGWTEVVHDCTSFRDPLVLPVTDGKMQVLWFHDAPSSGEACYPCPRHPTRLWGCHYDDHRWSEPAVIGEGQSWDPRSAAAAVSAVGEREVVVMVWRGEEGRMIYTAGTGWNGWTEPVVTDLEIGGQNWLVTAGYDLVLVTQARRNLYWCRLNLH
ncbi:MAG: hypothetical protein AMXMBFR13_47620 [Phycisphaerae bacterium]